jgi:hypothetical protein
MKVAVAGAGELERGIFVFQIEYWTEEVFDFQLASLSGISVSARDGLDCGCLDDLMHSLCS